jgi:PST family polysaccharide transporter
MQKNQNNKYELLFDTQALNKEVKQRSVKAGIANLISQAVLFTTTLVRAAILARLLSPEDYGVYTMVIVVISFALIFKDLGLSTATIREKEITHAQVSNLFWINTMIGLFSMLVVIAAAPGIVWFYKDSRLFLVALALSVAFLFAGLSVQHQAILKRQMQFGKIAIIMISAGLGSTLLGILVAWLRNDYWALIWMNVANNFFLMIGFWIFAKWIPGLPSKKAGTKKILKIGLDVAGLNAFSTITRDLDKIIAGRIASAPLLGLYTKGNQVPSLVSGQFRMAFFSVALPALSSLQTEKIRFSQYYYDFLNLICWVTIPLAVALFVFADEIIRIYFGPQWDGSAIFMQIFAIHALLMPAVTSLDQVPLALGHSRRYLAAGIVRSLGTIFCVSLGAMLYGVIGIAAGVAAAIIFTFIPFSRLCIQESPIKLKSFFKILSTPLLTAVAIGGVFYMLKSIYAADSIFCALLCMFFYFAVILACMLFFDFTGIGRSTGSIDFLFRKRARKIQT